MTLQNSIYLNKTINQILDDNNQRPIKINEVILHHIIFKIEIFFFFKLKIKTII